MSSRGKEHDERAVKLPLTRQSRALHGVALLPEHGLPPYWGAGLLQLRVRTRLPQDEEHASSHSDQCPLIMEQLWLKSHHALWTHDSGKHSELTPRKFQVCPFQVLGQVLYFLHQVVGIGPWRWLVYGRETAKELFTSKDDAT